MARHSFDATRKAGIQKDYTMKEYTPESCVRDLLDLVPIEKGDVRKIGATECEYYHEGYCLGKIELGVDFKCPGMKGNLNECTASNDDLVDGCIICEIRPANADFPYDEYCKECAKKMQNKENKQYDVR